MGSFSALHRQLHHNNSAKHHYRQEDVLPQAKLAQFNAAATPGSPLRQSHQPPLAQQKLRVRYDDQPEHHHHLLQQKQQQLQQQQQQQHHHHHHLQPEYHHHHHPQHPPPQPLQPRQASPQRQKLQPLDPNKTLPATRSSPFSLQRITQHFNIFKMVAAAHSAIPKTVVYADEQQQPPPPPPQEVLARTPPATPVIKVATPSKMAAMSPLKAHMAKAAAPLKSPAKKAPSPSPHKQPPRPTPRPKTLTPAATMTRPRKRRVSDTFSTYSESSSSGDSTPGSPRRKVLDGRVAKTSRAPRAKISPAAAGSVAAAATAAAMPAPTTTTTTTPRAGSSRRFASTDVVDELVSELNRGNQMDEVRCEQDMEMEKSLYPGGDSWADDEERLFEALFMRQYRPLLPESWTFDFRGIPAPEAIFARSPADAPLIYSCSGDNYQASRALVRLIQLTGTVRALVQSGVKTKAAATIRAELFRYAKWAAKDGGFSHHAVIPTFLLEVVDTSLSGSDVTAYIQNRMAELAEEHRDFLRRDPADAASLGPDVDPVYQEFRRPPPVLFGLFIIHTMVLILTVDSAKPPGTAQVSYHVEVNFNSPYQGVWNALTVAIPVCMARDDMRRRVGDFPLLEADSESDPDA
jgi:hypothetical protein